MCVLYCMIGQSFFRVDYYTNCELVEKYQGYYVRMYFILCIVEIETEITHLENISYILFPLLVNNQYILHIKLFLNPQWDMT